MLNGSTSILQIDRERKQRLPLLKNYYTTQPQPQLSFLLKTYLNLAALNELHQVDV